MFNTVRAATIETLIMPGELIEGHAKYETDCSSCHEKFERAGQTRLCLDCHEQIAEDVADTRGFHGRSNLVRDAECSSCHTDHKGRDADVVQLDPETFNHEITDFRLDGAHRLAACQACHEPDAPYRDAPSACFDCHEEDDTHRGNVGTDCATCHAAEGWARIAFDHDTTEFPLIGHHVDTACTSCHVNQQYEETPKDCFACHQIDDTHQGKRGRDCGACHSPKDWDVSSFDHGRETEFSLLGRHAEIRCNGCHIEDPEEKQLDKACLACHRSDDEHKGRRGDKCDKCHTSESWQHRTFDHNTDTEFRLHFRHAEIPCDSCHKGSVSDNKPNATCYACHRVEDPHMGQQGDVCSRCHNDKGWHVDVIFDHDLTRLPLIGLHAAVSCEECHLTAAYEDTSLECTSCHAQDDVHRNSLGPLCGRCHSPNAWSLWEFNHNKQTEFELLGAHEGLQCAACHLASTRSRPTASATCGTCHKEDDVHLGRFGRNCQRCHTVDDFGTIKTTYR